MGSFNAAPNPTGDAIARAFAQLLPKGAVHAVNVGTDGLGLGVPVVAAGRGIDLVGVSGALDWDLATGEVHSDSSAWCLSRLTTDGDAGATDAGDGGVSGLTLQRRAGLVWSWQGQSVSGTLACP